MADVYQPAADSTPRQHEGSELLAINNLPLYRFLTLLALKTTARFFQRTGDCIPISRYKVVKSVHLTKGVTLDFIARKTTIPVPKVHCSFIHKNRAYIVMERIHGETVPQAWRRLSDEGSLETMFAHLRSIIQELRALKPPPDTGVESCVGTSLRDCRITRSNPRFGPFETINGFHLWLREYIQPAAIENSMDKQEWQDIIMAIKQDGPWPYPVFTHADLNPFNILIRGDKVAAIIDWEFSGCYPHYWEYTSTWYGNLLKKEWQDHLHKFLDPFVEELTMEMTRQKWWGEY